MYTITFGDFVVHDPRTADRLVLSADPELVVDGAGSLSFTIPGDHPAAPHLERMAGELELRQDGLPIWRGRITRDTTNFDLSRTVEAEGALAYLCDSVVPPFNFPYDWEGDPDYEAAADTGNVVAFFLAGSSASTTTRSMPPGRSSSAR